LRVAFFADTNYVGSREWMAHFAGPLGIEVHAICFKGDATDLSSVTFHPIDPPGNPGKIRYLTCVPALRSALRRIQPDLLVAYRVLSYGFAASLSGFQPLVLAAQGQFIVSPEVPSLFRFFARRAVRRARLIHAWAEPMAQNLLALGADPSKTMVMPRGVALESFPPRDEPPAPFTLVTTRQLEPYYNFPVILEALVDLRRRAIPFRYLIAGEGSARADLEHRARSLGLEAEVQFLGRVEHRQLPGLLAGAHVYVSAVPTDGVSASLLEAMAAGVFPVVTDNAPNRIWIRHEENGLLFPARDGGALAAALERAWNDGELRRRARPINRSIVEERASWKANMSAIAERYRRIVREQGAAV
jgi:glycosyltransferase involved in cell wall biosynthesis